MIRRGIVTIALAGCLVAACGTTEPSPQTARPSAAAAASSATAAPTGPTTIDGGPAPAPSFVLPTRPPLDPDDAWAGVTSAIERDGTVPLDVALTAFALLIGPLPGVDPPRGDTPRISSGSGPVRWLLGHWDDLTPAQRDAVEALLAPRPASTRVPAAPFAAPARLAASIAAVPSCPGGNVSPRQGEFDDKVVEATGSISAMLGRPLGLPVSVIFQGVSSTAAETVPLGADCKPTTLRPAVCQIQVTNRGEGLSGFEFSHIVAHETFHCFQYDIAKTAADAARVAPWLAEGSAAWVGEVVSSGSTVGAEYWENWLKFPWWPVFSRTYDGIGFFMHLQESGIDPWKILVTMLRKGESSSADAYLVAATGGSSDRMLDALGPSYIRELSLSPDWSTVGAGLPEYVKTPVISAALANGDVTYAGANPLAAFPLTIEATADALVIRESYASPGKAHGLVRFADGTQKALEEAVGKPFCLKPGGCTCPTGSAGAGHAWQTASQGHVLFGLFGHTDGIIVTIEGMSVDTTCSKAPKDFVPPENCFCPPGPLGSVESNGAADRRVSG